MLGEIWLLVLLLTSPHKVSADLNGCGKEHISSTAITTELQSDVMLPCYFNLSILGSDQAEDVAVVWSQTDSAVHNLSEITINGGVRLRDSKNKRVKTFPGLSDSGNFSIVLQKAQFSDQSLYRCELFKGIHCIIAYQELNLSVTSCRRGLLPGINITTELQSDVLLPCYFQPSILGSDVTADIAAVWSQRNVAAGDLLKIKLQGNVTFWKSRSENIKTFSELSATGNFSILLRNLQLSDLGLYRCELSKGTSCSLAYQDIYLTAAASSSLMRYWPYILGTAVALCLLLVCLFFTQWRRRRRAEPLYINTHFHQNKSERKEENIYENDTELMKMKRVRAGHNPAQENPVYVNWVNKR